MPQRERRRAIADVGDHGDTASGVVDGKRYGPRALYLGQQRELAGCAHHPDAVDATLDQEVDQAAQRSLVDRLIAIQRRHHRAEDAVEGRHAYERFFSGPTSSAVAERSRSLSQRKRVSSTSSV